MTFSDSIDFDGSVTSVSSFGTHRVSACSRLARTRSEPCSVAEWPLCKGQPTRFDTCNVQIDFRTSKIALHHHQNRNHAKRARDCLSMSSELWGNASTLSFENVSLKEATTQKSNYPILSRRRKDSKWSCTVKQPPWISGRLGVLPKQWLFTLVEPFLSGLNVFFPPCLTTLTFAHLAKWHQPTLISKTFETIL